MDMDPTKRLLLIGLACFAAGAAAAYAAYGIVSQRATASAPTAPVSVAPVASTAPAASSAPQPHASTTASLAPATASAPAPADPSWTREKAAHLAERALLGATQQDADALYAAGSAKAAVSLLFAPPSAADMQAYQSGLSRLEASIPADVGTSTRYATERRNAIYSYELVHDPDRLRRSVYYLWENIFSVDSQVDQDDRITDADVSKLHDILYAGALGNYLELVSQVQGTFAMDRYLDLINSTKKDPNENYAREYMQLFLMGAYPPTDHSLSQPNYSEADVNALAYLLSGYKASLSDHSVYFDPTAHYDGTKEFLGQTVSFATPEEVQAYLVSQRKTAISEFVAYKLLKYFVSDSPTDQDIVAFAQVVRDDDFEIAPALRWLLSSYIMFDPAHMQEDRYRSPLGLLAALYVRLYGRAAYDVYPAPYELTDLDFEPFRPGSIFGRDGFNVNAHFFSGTVLDKFIGDTDRALRGGQNKAQTMAMLSNLVAASDGTARGFIGAAAHELYVGRDLPQGAASAIVSYLTAGGSVSDSAALDSKNGASLNRMLGAIDLIVAQPEFVMAGGDPSARALPTVATGQSQGSSGGSASGKPVLVVVRLRGGLDFQQLVANAADPAYAADRKALALTSSDSQPLGAGYVLSDAGSSLMPLLKSHQAFIVAGDGLPNQIRAHDIASMQMETGLSSDGEGIASLLVSADPSLKLVSLTSTPPIFFRGAESLQIGSADLRLFPELGKDPYGQMAALHSSLASRLLPTGIAAYYAQALLLDSLAKDDIASGGKGTPGGSNKTQLPFLSTLIGKGLGDVYYLYGDSGYDTHADEEPNLDKDLSSLFQDLTSFFEREAPSAKITLIVFSEFGRTDKTNGNGGTDHGTGGGMVVLSNQLSWPALVGGFHPSQDKNNWSDVAVDARDVWSSIGQSLFGISPSSLFGRSQTISSYPATVSLP